MLSYLKFTQSYSKSIMKAVLFETTGGLEVLKYVTDVPAPVISSPNDIIIRNHTIGVNFIDTYHRSGVYKVELPCIPGREGAGVVEQVGSQVDMVKPGDRVAYLGMGTYSELSKIDTPYVFPLPDDMSFEEGSAMMIQGFTAIALTKLAYPIKKGDIVLIHAAAGGTGSLLVQIAKHLGAVVIGTTSTPEKAIRVKSLGADHVILYKESDVVEEVLKITNGVGVDAVYDGVGKSTFDISLKSLKRLGFLLSFGNASGKVDDIPLMKIVPKAIRLMRPSMYEFIKNKEDFDYLKGELENLLKLKKLKFHIHKVYDLENAKNAQGDLEEGQTVGKLLLQVK